MAGPYSAFTSIMNYLYQAFVTETEIENIVSPSKKRQSSESGLDTSPEQIQPNITKKIKTEPSKIKSDTYSASEGKKPDDAFSKNTPVKPQNINADKNTAVKTESPNKKRLADVFYTEKSNSVQKRVKSESAEVKKADPIALAKAPVLPSPKKNSGATTKKEQADHARQPGKESSTEPISPSQPEIDNPTSIPFAEIKDLNYTTEQYRAVGVSMKRHAESLKTSSPGSNTLRESVVYFTASYLAYFSQVIAYDKNIDKLDREKLGQLLQSLGKMYESIVPLRRYVVEFAKKQKLNALASLVY